MVWGCISAHSMVICIYVAVAFMQRLLLEFWRRICCCQDDDFSQKLHVYFKGTMPGLILHELQQRGFVGIECVCLTGLPAVQICLLLKMYGADVLKLCSPSLVYTKNGQNFACKTETIDMFSSQTITKCDKKKR